VVVPIYETSSRDDCAYLLSDSGAHALICEDAEQLEKTAGLDLPALRLTVAFEDAEERAVASTAFRSEVVPSSQGVPSR
jgi:long-subunit acyl-CoA synthetase (AMP-forming)